MVGHPTRHPAIKMKHFQRIVENSFSCLLLNVCGFASIPWGVWVHLFCLESWGGVCLDSIVWADSFWLNSWGGTILSG